MGVTLTTLVYLFWGALGLTTTLLIGFTALWTHRMPKPSLEDELCQPVCWLPPIYPWTWDDTQYRCKECGKRWQIKTDLSLSVEEYRKWAA